MFFNRKREPEPVQEVATEIWKCVMNTCSGWARKEFFIGDEPICPLCSGEMISEIRDLPILMDRLPN